MITFEDFEKIDLRVGTIVSAEPVPKADCLAHLTVDLGEGRHRTIVGKIRQYYSLENLPGRQVVVVANLEPRKVFGIMSEGMLLAVKDANGLSILSPDQPRTPGSRAG